MGFALRLYTNATLIDDDVADRIASLRPLGVEVSLHGARAETQDRIARRSGSFEKVLHGVRLLRARGVPVLLKCVVTHHNYRELDDLRALAAQLGCTTLFDAEVTPKNDGDRAPTSMGVDDAALLQVARDIWGSKNGCAHSEVVGLDDRLDDAPCSAARRTCHIGPTGDVSPCTQWPEPYGNVRRERFADIWASDPFDRIRAKKLRDLEGCASCAVLGACAPCTALSLLEHGDLDGPSDTKCRTAPARAAMLGIDGEANARAPRSRDLVQLGRRLRA